MVPSTFIGTAVVRQRVVMRTLDRGFEGPVFSLSSRCLAM